MDKTDNLSPEELIAEQEVLKGKSREDIRANVIDEYGFDEVDDVVRIDKLVEREVDSTKRLSAAIGQKIKYREALNKAPAVVAPKIDPEDIDKRLDEKLTARLEKEALDSMDYPDELKAEIQNVAKAKGVSVKIASRDAYILFKVEDYNKTKKADEAAISRTNKSSGKSTYSFDEPPELDTSSEEAFKKSSDELDKWQAEMKKQGY